MNEKKMSTGNQTGPKSSSVQEKKGVVNNIEKFEIPYEAACSPEFIQGCILREDGEGNAFEE